MTEIIEKILMILAILCITIVCIGSALYQSRSNSKIATASEVEYYSEEIVELPEVIEEEEIADIVAEMPVAEMPYSENLFIKSDMQVMAEAVAGEAKGEPLVGQVAVAATLLNRMEYYNQTVYQALEAYNAYPYYGPVPEECYRAVEIAMDNRDLFPRDMMYFRAGGYHSFGVPYCQIGNHYFSTKE